MSCFGPPSICPTSSIPWPLARTELITGWFATRKVSFMFIWIHYKGPITTNDPEISFSKFSRHGELSLEYVINILYSGCLGIPDLRVTVKLGDNLVVTWFAIKKMKLYFIEYLKKGSDGIALDHIEELNCGECVFPLKAAKWSRLNICVTFFYWKYR